MTSLQNAADHSRGSTAGLRDNLPTTHRAAPPQDAIVIAAIHRDIAHNTAISCELEPPSVGELAVLVTSVLRSHPWLVCATDGAGDAYVTQLGSRAARDHSSLAGLTQERRGSA